MASGLFITLYDEESLENCIRNGIYGFLMDPEYDEKPQKRKHYAILSDYACCEEGTEIFFFNEKTITYGGTITLTNHDDPVFYLNGDTSPLGRKINSKMYVDMSDRYETTDRIGVYNIGKYRDGKDIFKAMPFVIEFDCHRPLSGKQISSDELYFELGKYNFPFPSNSIQGKGFCTLTLKETKILLDLLERSNEKLELENTLTNDTKINNGKKQIFKTSFITEIIPINEHHLEFMLLAEKKKLDEIIYKSLPNIPKENYIRCRQVPMCPFRPIQFDMADICLYSKNNPIKDFTLPNIIIELKYREANYKSYEQVTKYLRWIKQIAPEEFDDVKAIIIAPRFVRTLKKEDLIRRGISLEYDDNIILYSLNEDKVIKLN